MKEQFANDIRNSLSGNRKFINHRYVFDEKGDALFEKLMETEDYYLTNCEIEILQNNKVEIKKLFSNNNSPFQLVDLGVGNGIKTEILIEYFIQTNTNFEYIPVDLSKNAVDKVSKKFKAKYPEIVIKSMPYEYFKAIEMLNKETTQKKCYLFLGSSIGNLEDKERILFLRKLQDRLNENDLVYIGFDLKKNPKITNNAYRADSQTVSDFMLNALNHINKVFSANFQPENFEYYSDYNLIESKVNFELISRVNQSIKITELNLELHLDKNELINVGHSKKFAENEIENIAKLSGFEIVEQVFDKKHYFANTILKKNTNNQFTRIKPYFCLRCKAAIEPLYEEYHSSGLYENAEWYEGIIETITGGYGSKFDTASQKIAICDACLNEAINHEIVDVVD